MSVILAFEASADACSVSLRLSPVEVNILKSDEPRAHAAHLLPFVQELLDQAGRTINDIDYIACAVGPGSFTGLRIALSVAQGLAFSANKKIVPINSLSALAFSAQAPADCTVLPMMDARMAEVYWGAYSSEGVALNESLQAVLGAEDSLLADLEAIPSPQALLPVGNAWDDIAFAQAAQGSLSMKSPLLTQVDAGHIAALADKQLPLGALDPQLVDLCYCRNSIAWNKRTRIRS